MAIISLAINTASRSTSIALIKDKKVFAEKCWISENNEAEKLMPEIDKLLKSKKISYEDLSKVIVIKGPGSFTGLRVGIGLGNAISYVQKIPIFSIDTFSFLRKRNSVFKVSKKAESKKKVQEKAVIKKSAQKNTISKNATSENTALKDTAQQNTALLLLAGKSEVYIQLNEKGTPYALKLEEAKKFLKEKGIKTIFGELLEEQRKVFKDFEFIDSGTTFGEAVALLSDKDLEKSKIVAPLYVKDPQISLPKPFK